MKQALILCGGEAQRLRPYSHNRPKSCMPFLNLPLLSLSWFYMEQMSVSRFLLNAHLFPEKLKEVLGFVSQKEQRVDVFPEERTFGGAGTLYKLKDHLYKTEHFFYINGDSLFLPSDLNQLVLFEEHFLKTGAEASFFSAPLESWDSSLGLLWADSEGNLKFAGSEKKLPQELKSQKLSPYYFSGLALFKSSLLENLKEHDFHLFEDFINPLLSKKSFKVFSDKGLQVLEAGEKMAYIKSLELCLSLLFEKKKGIQPVNFIPAGKAEQPSDSSFNIQLRSYEINSQNVRSVLEKWLSRFDPKDRIVGLKNGRKWGRKLGQFLLAPDSVKGLKHLTLEGPAVLGQGVHLFGKSLLDSSLLDSGIHWRGDLKKEIILNNSSSE